MAQHDLVAEAVADDAILVVEDLVGARLGMASVERDALGEGWPGLPQAHDGPVALVIGASGAIGRVLVAALADSGHHVLAVGRDLARLQQAAGARTAAVTCLAADITRDIDRETLVRAVARHRRLDVLVFGAGVYERSGDPEMLRQQFEANVLGPYALLRAVTPALIGSRGQVVFLNSTQGLAASPGLAQYASTQHAMRAIADSFRDEVNKDGVRVSSIFLGRTATERQARIFAMEERAYTPEALIQPEDVVAVIDTLLRLPRTAEVTNVAVRPMSKLA